jgi:membrane protein implicated in regulation of membrane protease activity
MGTIWIWWVAAAVLIGVELLTGTFYLLAVGFAVAIGGVAAWLGASLGWQFLVAGTAGVLLTIVAHRWRLSRTPAAPDRALDVGQPVQVKSWNADGTARVAYRGSTWNAELESPAVSRSAPLYIASTKGSVLVLSDRRPA